MSEEVPNKVVKVVGILADKFNKQVSPDEALKYTQAMCNAANTVRALEK